MASKQDVTRMVIDNAKARGLEALHAAILRMRDACDAAEQGVRRAHGAAGIDSRVIARVMHELAWGHANATSSIESAMGCIEDIREAEREKNKSDA